jgi:GNAT superfamily N-acetyltransferase
MTADYELSTNVPGIDEYRHLRVAAGLSPRSAQAAALGLPNTLFAVTIRHQGKLIGMGRVVGDGGLSFQVVDIAVEPAFQGQSLGKAIVGRLVDYLHQTARPSASATLFADGEAHRLYAQFGFEPTAPDSIGMALVIK